MTAQSYSSAGRSGPSEDGSEKIRAGGPSSSSSDCHLPVTTSLPWCAAGGAEVLFAVAVVFDQIGVGDAVSAVDFCDAAGGVEDEFDDFAGTAAGSGGGSRVHCEKVVVEVWRDLFQWVSFMVFGEMGVES